MSKCVCPICGAEKDMLIKHVTMAHKITREEFVTKFPDSKLVSEEVSTKISSANKRNWSTNPEYRERCSSYWRSDEHGKHVSDRLKELWETDHDAVKKYLLDGVTEEVRKGRAIRMQKLSRKLWDDPEYVNQTRDRLFNRRARSLRYKGVTYRSSWEVQVVKVLNFLDVTYEYESLRFNYVDPEGVPRIYITDFYLPDYNLVLEVKPPYFIDDEIVVLKQESVLRTDYRYEYITSDRIDVILPYLVHLLGKFK